MTEPNTPDPQPDFGEKELTDCERASAHYADDDSIENDLSKHCSPTEVAAEALRPAPRLVCLGPLKSSSLP